MPDINNGTLTNLDAPTRCAKKVYVSKMAVGRFSELNKSTTTIASNAITAIAMEGGASMYAVNAPTKNIQWNGQFTQDQGNYIANLVADIAAISSDTFASINVQENFCDWFAYVQLSDGGKFFIGMDLQDGQLEQFFYNYLNDHSYSAGGGNDTTNIPTWTFETLSLIHI